MLASCGPELIDRMWARVIATEFARAPVVKLGDERDLTAMDLSVLVVEDNPFQQQAIGASARAGARAQAGVGAGAGASASRKSNSRENDSLALARYNL